MSFALDGPDVMLANLDNLRAKRFDRDFRGTGTGSANNTASTTVGGKPYVRPDGCIRFALDCSGFARDPTGANWLGEGGAAWAFGYAGNHHFITEIFVVLANLVLCAGAVLQNCSLCSSTAAVSLAA
jgi:hypothetical protein